MTSQRRHHELHPGTGPSPSARHAAASLLPLLVLPAAVRRGGGLPSPVRHVSE